MEFSYKKQLSVDERKKIAEKILQKDRIPLVCEPDPKNNFKSLNKTHFLVPQEMTVAQFGFVLRKKIQLESNSSLFLTVNGEISITGNLLMNEIYKKYKDPEDNVLYIMYSCELVWG